MFSTRPRVLNAPVFSTPRIFHQTAFFLLDPVFSTSRVFCTPHVHSGQTTGHSREHARDLSTSGQFPSSSHKNSTVNLRHSSHLGSIILPLQTFFSRVLLLRQQPFSSENLPPESPERDNYRDKNTSLHVRYELVNSTRKFTIVAEIVSLLKKIYQRFQSLVNQVGVVVSMLDFRSESCLFQAHSTFFSLHPGV